jgi:hypothetical protein
MPACLGRCPCVSGGGAVAAARCVWGNEWVVLASCLPCFGCGCVSVRGVCVCVPEQCSVLLLTFVLNEAPAGEPGPDAESTLALDGEERGPGEAEAAGEPTEQIWPSLGEAVGKVEEAATDAAAERAEAEAEADAAEAADAEAEADTAERSGAEAETSLPPGAEVRRDCWVEPAKHNIKKTCRGHKKGMRRA